MTIAMFLFQGIGFDARHEECAMDGYNEEDEERFANEIEAMLGWKLDAEQRTVVARRRTQGESAAALVQEIERINTARDALNDRDASLYPSPTRPDDDDPRHFADSSE